MRYAAAALLALLLASSGGSAAAQDAPTPTPQAPLRVELEHLQLQGNPDKATLRRALKPLRAALDRCLLAYPPPQGREHLLLILGRDAARQRFGVLRAVTSHGGAEVDACLSDVLSRVTLPRSQEPCGVSRVAVPLRAPIDPP